MTDEFKAWALDTAERTVFTFAQSFLGLILASASGAVEGLSASTLEVALLSAVISSLAVLKGAIAKRRDGISPASLLRAEPEE